MHIIPHGTPLLLPRMQPAVLGERLFDRISPREAEDAHLRRIGGVSAARFTGAGE